MSAPRFSLVEFSCASGFDYLWKLVQEYPLNTVKKKKDFFRLIDPGKHFWKVVPEGFPPAGVIYLAFHDRLNVWTFDAYRDHSVKVPPKTQFFITVTAAREVLDFFFRHIFYDIIYTTHDVRNISATKLCEAAGFKALKTVVTDKGEMIILSKRREEHGN